MTQEPAQKRGVVRSEKYGHILKMTIDNVAKKNSFIPEMMLELSNALTQLENDNELRVGVLCAEGEHFTAGLDMPKFFGPGVKPLTVPEGNIDPVALENKCSKPIITAVQGITYAVGIEIMLAGDIVIAAESARFTQIEPRRGIAAVGGAHFRFITRTGWGNAMYHLLLADEFDAVEAHRIGLVQELVPHGKQTERAMQLAERIAKNAPIAVQITKKAGRAFIQQGEQDAIAMIPEMKQAFMGSEDMLEGIQSFVERREAVFTGK